MIPKTIEERKLWGQGYRFVACIDEAGRGPLAGPVVAAAVCFVPKLSRDKENLKRLSFPRLRDSKKLSPKRRGEIYNKVKKHSAMQWGIGIVSERVIDRINIYQATKLAMVKAVKALSRSLSSHTSIHHGRVRLMYPDFLIVDGNMKLEKISIPQKSIVKGDEKVFSCALASIIAKVTRDRIMARYHKKYPQYGFDKHKGYGTVLHLQRLREYGPCPIHRRSFAPMKSEARNPKSETNPKF